MFRFYIPARILYGAGSLGQLHEQALPGKKALVVISSGKSARASGALDRVLSELSMAGAQAVVYDRVGANPTREAVMAGAAVSRENGCDFIVGLGGGSVLDAGKGIAVMSTNSGDLWDYMMAGSGGRKPLEAAPLPIVAIPTTAGTGSEADVAAVITWEERHEKIGLRDPRQFPVLSIVDAELMKGVPAHFTAYQGFDALFHSAESYISNKANMMSDTCALSAIEKVGQYLPRAVADGNDMEAREAMAFASSMGGFVMSTAGTTSEHSMEHAISAYHTDVAHGAGLIMICEAYFERQARVHACDERMIRMAKALGKADAAEPADFVAALHELRAACGVDDLKMTDYGITEEELPVFAHNAVTAMAFLFGNERVPMTEEDCLEIYRRSYR
ncbi:MAG: iron-containing alcohol dehydrogenase [Lachnospiraceae bacterium]|nr:iron-containing alcohol dehydrogenase [Lachnospiraceae bacterium]